MRWWGILSFLVLFAVSVQAQPAPVVTLTIQAGYEGYFRPFLPFPVYIRATNNGNALNGALVVRPQSNGRLISNAFSVPIDLPQGADKTVFMSVNARNFEASLTIELLDSDGVRIAQASTPILPIQPRETLYATLTGEGTPTLVFGEAGAVGERTLTAHWKPNTFPDNPLHLTALTALWVGNLPADALTPAQQEAIRLYALSGGHVVLWGGANSDGTQQITNTWQSVSTFSAQTRSIDSLTPLAEFAYTPDTLDGLTRISELNVQGDVLAHTEDGLPLLVRHSIGGGTIDNLTIDPTTEPFKSWQNAPRFWQTLIGSVPLKNSWSYGISDASSASEAIAILPNDNLYPPVNTIVAFIGAYVFFVGILNYWVLSYFKRQEWAWISIPMFIVGFSVIAYWLGSSLRESSVILSQVRVVQLWQNTDTALEQGLVGVLSPRREEYTLRFDSAQGITLLPSVGQTLNAVQSPVTIAQTTRIQAESLPVDGGIFANFSTWRTVTAPSLRGEMRVIQQSDGTKTLIGSLINDTPSPLSNVVILAQGVVYHVAQPLNAGGILTLEAGELVLGAGGDVAIPARIEGAFSGASTNINLAQSFSYRPDDLITANRVTRNPLFVPSSEAEQRAQVRRELIASAFMRDQYRSTALSNQVVVMAWSDTAPDDVSVDNNTWRTVANTLYILTLTPDMPTTESVILGAENVMWQVIERNGSEGGADDVRMNAENESITLRFTPLIPLEHVERLTFSNQRASGFAGETRLELFNWQTQTWDDKTARRQSILIENPAPYLGNRQAVQVRLTYTYESGLARLRDVFVGYEGKPKSAP